MECIYIFNEINKLTKQGVSLNDITIMNIDESYEYILKRLSYNYNLPIEFNKDKNILTTDFAVDLLYKMDKFESFNELVLELDNQSMFYNKFIDLINEYKLYKYKPVMVYEFIVNKLKSMTYDSIKYKESIQIKDNYNPKESEYVFFVGFNLGSAPRIFKNDKYLDDEELEKLGLETSMDKNLESKEKMIKFIKNTKN